MQNLSLNLTLDECIRVNNNLLKAVKNAEIGAIRDIISALAASDVKGKLKVRGWIFFCLS